jgi:hypothetical protein
MLNIPTGSTGPLELLEKEFFRQWKELCGCVSGKLMCDGTSKFDLLQRDGTLKMQSFILSLKFELILRVANTVKFSETTIERVRLYTEGFITVTETTESISFCMLHIWKTIA